MSSEFAISTLSAQTQPTFKSIFSSEFFKLLHNRMVTTFAAIIFGIFAINILGTTVIFTSILSINKSSDAQSNLFLMNTLWMQVLQTNMSWSGIMMIFLTVMAIGQDYQNGVIRVILARGAGRMRVLAAKYTAALLYAFFVLIAQYIVTAAFLFSALSVSNNLDLLNRMPSNISQEIILYGLVTLVSVIVTGFMAAALTTLGRSLTFGFAFALLWFPVEGILKFMAMVLSAAYSLQFYETVNKITNAFLGSAITNLGSQIFTQNGQTVTPLTVNGFTLSAPSALTDGIIITVYAAIFLVGMFTYARMKDVQN